MLLLYHVWTPVLVSVFETRNWTNFEEFKTLQHVLLLELNLVKAILAASRITYNIQSYSYLFQDSWRTLSGLFVVPVTIISSTTKSSFILQITFTVPTVNSVTYGDCAFSSVHLHHGILFPIHLKMQTYSRSFDLPWLKHSYFGNYNF